MKKAIKQMQIK